MMYPYQQPAVVGSIPTSSSTKKGICKADAFFVDSAGCQPAPPFGIEMLGMAKPSLRRGFAWGKTLVRCKSTAAQKGRRARFKIIDHNFKILKSQWLIAKKGTM